MVHHGHRTGAGRFDDGGVAQAPKNPAMIDSDQTSQFGSDEFNR
jgi:hypothetical protein